MNDAQVREAAERMRSWSEDDQPDRHPYWRNDELEIEDKATVVQWTLARLDADAAEAVERAAMLSELLQVFKAADEARLSEVHERDSEADKWQAEGDMYGWNFHKGLAAGCTTASIIFHRVQRAIEKKLDLLAALKGGAK